MPERLIADCAVVGLGPAGLATALAFAWEGLSVVAIGTPVVAPDLRTAALFQASVRLLGNVGIWPTLAPTAAPLRALRLVDATGALVHVPEILFEARELGLAEFGFNIENQALSQSMRAASQADPNISVIEDHVSRIEVLPDCVRLTVARGQVIEARLVAAADGRLSATRAAAGIQVTEWTVPQTAIATRFRHGHLHDWISTEFHRNAGPLTTVPMPGRWSSLVWVEFPEEARRLAALDGALFARELEEHLCGLLGTVEEVAPRRAFPLTGLSATRMAAGRIALVGEAAHVLPPIGAQGLNLGLRDAATLAEEAADGRARFGDPGAELTLQRYAARRHGDAVSRTLVVDLLNRSLISGFLPLALARAGGLALIDSMPWLRRLAMLEGMQPQGALPRLMER